MNKSLLHTPDGVRDLYGEELQKKLSAQTKVLKLLESFGYNYIETPTFEFFDVYSKEVGTKPSTELYKFFDLENNTLVLRPDFTPSIARCAVKYFGDTNSPLRFCYKGNCFTRIMSHQGKLSESTEMGAELIGDSSVMADAEMIVATIESLRATGLKDFRVTIGNVEYFKGLCAAAGLSDQIEMELRSFVSGKNLFGAEELLNESNISKEDQSRLLYTTNLIGDGSILKAAKEQANNERSANAISRLEELYSILKDMYGMDEYVAFDLGMLSKYNYYTGIIFKVFTYGVGVPIIAGGRYDSLLAHFGKNMPAIGFAIRIDDLLEALSRQNAAFETPKQPICLYYDIDDKESLKAAIEKANSLRKSGENVVLNPKEVK